MNVAIVTITNDPTYASVGYTTDSINTVRIPKGYKLKAGNIGDMWPIEGKDSRLYAEIYDGKVDYVAESRIKLEINDRHISFCFLDDAESALAVFSFEKEGTTASHYVPEVEILDGKITLHCDMPKGFVEQQRKSKTET